MDLCASNRVASSQRNARRGTRSPADPAAEADQNSYLLGRVGNFKVLVACLPKDQIGSVSAAVVARDKVPTFPKIRIGLLEQAPLLWAVGSQGHDICEKLLRGLPSGSLHFDYHSRNDPKANVEILLEHGADPKLHAQGVEPTLIAAFSRRDKSLIRHLLRAGCNPNAKSKSGETPLYRAAALGFDDLVELLCVHGANPRKMRRITLAAARHQKLEEEESDLSKMFC
jgi:hypothetical protein